MSEEIIRITIDYVLDEIKKTNIDNFDGLCFYFSQNIMSYLEEQGIETKIYNIRDLTDIMFDHYFLIADGFLIDLTYSQFLPKNGELRFFDEWPSNILKNSIEGEKILNSLLSDGYFKIDNNFDIYLNSFKKKENNYENKI
ncbi:MAG: hypothetical protein IKF91_04035 [Bacilli bacterium]|nr:hypothetical protein [Bacilli bacterium]